MTDSDGGFLTFLYTLWLPLDNDEFGDSDTEDSYIQKFHQNSVYFVTEKFTMLATDPQNSSSRPAKTYKFTKKRYRL